MIRIVPLYSTPYPPDLIRDTNAKEGRGGEGRRFVVGKSRVMI
jgi:hypothetical protein